MRKEKVYGYARVSTQIQREDRQMTALREFGVATTLIYVEKQSGKNFNRPIYLQPMKKLKKSDTLVVTSIDRLGRNYNEIIEQWRIISKVIGAHIVVLDMPLLDTRKKEVDLTGTFIADLVLQVLSYVAQIERMSLIARQAEGIAAAKEKGIRFGRPPKTKPCQFSEYAEKYRENEISATKAAKILQIPRSTFLSWI